MKNNLLKSAGLVAIVATMVSCGSSVSPSSSGLSSASSSSKEKGPLEIIAADFASTNFTVSYLSTGLPYQVEYLFQDGVYASRQSGEDIETKITSYGRLDENGVTLFNVNEAGAINKTATVSYPYDGLTADYLLGYFRKETLAEAFAALSPRDVTYKDGAYHIDKLAFHVDAEYARAFFGCPFTPLNDGTEYPMVDISFTVDGGHIARFAMSSYSCRVDFKSEVFVVDYERGTLPLSIAFSDFGTTSFPVPPEIRGDSSLA